jgi:DNA-binding transcriptional regulator GbsR (MarR family)
VKITKQYLRTLIKEVISEQTVPREIEDAVKSDEDLEKLLTAMAEKINELETALARRKDEYEAATTRMARITAQRE